MARYRDRVRVGRASPGHGASRSRRADLLAMLAYVSVLPAGISRSASQTRCWKAVPRTSRGKARPWAGASTEPSHDWATSSLVAASPPISRARGTGPRGRAAGPQDRRREDRRNSRHSTRRGSHRASIDRPRKSGTSWSPPSDSRVGLMPSTLWTPRRSAPSWSLSRRVVRLCDRCRLGPASRANSGRAAGFSVGLRRRPVACLKRRVEVVRAEPPTRRIARARADRPPRRSACRPCHDGVVRGLDGYAARVRSGDTRESGGLGLSDALMQVHVLDWPGATGTRACKNACRGDRVRTCHRRLVTRDDLASRLPCVMSIEVTSRHVCQKWIGPSVFGEIATARSGAGSRIENLLEIGRPRPVGCPAPDTENRR